MNWYISQSNNFNIIKTAGYSAYVKDFKMPDQWDNLENICVNLNEILYSEMKKYNLNTMADNDWPNFSPDGSEYGRSVGVINFYVMGLDRKYCMWVMTLVKNILNKNNIELSNISQEGYENESDSWLKKELEGKIRVIRFVISKNSSKKGDIPTPLHWTGSNINRTLQILGLPDIESETEYNASDIKNKYEKLIEEARLKNLDIESVVLAKTMMSFAEFRDNRMMYRIRQLYDIACWAESHGYKQIYFA